jgi:hypothetical protein
MIQRVQTIYLLLIFGLMVCLLFLPVATIDSFHWTLSVECGLTALLSIITVFLYKKRKLQMNICYGILTLLVLSYLIIFFDFWLPSHDAGAVVEFQVPVVFPLFAIVLDILTIRAIQKDEKLVRSMDRLR